MRHISSCPNCKAGAKFIKVTSEPGNGAQVMFCGRCHKVISSSESSVSEPVDHLNQFAKSMTNMLMAVSGTEVMSSVYVEGVKAGVEMALSVPWSEKEKYWMEKYGVVNADLIKELEEKLAMLKSIEKTAETSVVSSRPDQIASIEEKIRELKSSINH